MKVNQNYLEDIKEIRILMEKSSRFLSLSGLSGISAGIIAISGALVARIFIGSDNTYFDEYFRVQGGQMEINVLRFLIIDASVILLLALFSGFYFSFRRAGNMGISFWNPASKRLLVNLFIPLITGGIVCIISLFQQGFNLIIPMMLIFYGLALINAGKYTEYNINYLGFTEILTGLLAMMFTEYSVYFWVLGFGVWHVLYGSVYYFRYEKPDKPVND